MWKERQQSVHNTCFLRGGAPLKKLDDIKTASSFAYTCGLSKKDSEYAFVTFCVAFTTTSLMKTIKDLAGGDPNAPA